MPRPAKGPRLYLNPAERVWLIRDGPHTERTGCGELDRPGAEKRLGEYLTLKFRPTARESHPARLSVAEVLTAYGREHAPTVKAPATIGYAIAALAPWWGVRTLAEVNKKNCKAYGDARGVKDGTVRRELGVLAAAINYWHENHGPLDSVPAVSLPPKAGSRKRWLTRTEVAMLIAGAIGFYREFWSDVATRKEHFRWRRYHGGINRHVARFILLGMASGTRRGALLDLQWMANTSGGWVDVDAGVMHRRSDVDVETNKRKPPARLGTRILLHLKRWDRLDARSRAQTNSRRPGEPVPYMHIVTWMGRKVDGVRTSWEAAVELAWLGADVTPHVLRHTRATWLMQKGVDMWQASGQIGMSLKTLEDNYGHHHPDWQKEAAEI